MSEPLSVAGQLAKEYAALNTATERAHTAIKDLAAERALLRSDREAARNELRAEIAAITSLCERLTRITTKRAEDMIEAEVRRQFIHLVPQVRKLLEGALERVSSEFDSVTKLILGRFGADGSDAEKDFMRSVRAKVEREGGPVLRPGLYQANHDDQ